MNPFAWSGGLEPKDWVSSALAALAVVVAAAGLSYARRSARAADRSATEAARSANAAERQAEASERQAAAAEAMTTVAAAPPAPVTWKATSVDKITYRLRNIGVEPATDVRVTGLPPDAAWLVRFADGGTVPAGRSVDVTVLSVDGAAVDALEVTWGAGDSAILPLAD